MQKITSSNLSDELKKQCKKQGKKEQKALLKKIKKYDTIGALWLNEKDMEQIHINSSSIDAYTINLFKKKDQHTGNKYYFELLLMSKISDLENKVKELEEKLTKKEQ